VDIVKAVHAAAEHVGPVYIKIGSPPMPVLMDEAYPFRIGKGVVLQDGGDVTLIGTGTVFSKAAGAAKLLKDKGIHARLINLHTIKPLDTELILKAARETGRIVTVEEGYTAGGMGGCIAEFLSAEHPVRVWRIGIDDRFAEPGPYEDVLALYGLQSEQIADSVVSFLKS
jgi:transketolase